MLRKLRIAMAAAAGIVVGATLAWALTYTPNKAFPIPTPGSDTNNWGTILNNAIGQIDLALGGGISVSVAGNTNVTLTSTQAENLAYTFTGALTGNISVLFPATKGLYVLTNSTSGSYGLTIGTTNVGSTTVIPQGTTSLVYSDGTNIFGITGQGGINTAYNATIGGNATVAGTLGTTGLLTATGGISSASGGANIGGGVSLSGVQTRGGGAVTATGNTQGTAVAVDEGVTAISGGAANTGVILPTNPFGTYEVILNQTNTAKAVYPRNRESNQTTTR